MFVLGKSLELIAKLQGKMLITHKEKKPENWDGNEEEDDTEEVEVESSDNIVVEDMDNVTHWDIVMEFNKMTIHTLVKEVLNLPPSLSSRFEIEATRLQLGASLYNFKSIDCIQGCDGQSDEGSSVEFIDNLYHDDDSDEDGNDFYSDSELETDTDDSLNNSEDDYDDFEDDYVYNEDDNLDNMYINGDLDKSPAEMDVESTTDEDPWHTEY
jgi:hypothetical protein